MGTSDEEITEVVFDTGSSWLVMETTDCSACTGKYDISTSTAYSATTRAMSQTYGDGTSIVGVQASDDACFLSSSLCASDFNWMNIQSTGLGDDLNGILGLSHNPSAFSTLYPADDLMTVLYDDGVITANTFAFGLRGYTDADSSFIDIGHYNTNAMDDSTQLIWTDVATDPYYGDGWWQNYMTGVRFRDQVTGSVTYATSVANAVEYSTNVYNILSIIDSGSSCLVLSSSVYDFVLSQLQSYLTTY